MKKKVLFFFGGGSGDPLPGKSEDDPVLFRKAPSDDPLPGSIPFVYPHSHTQTHTHSHTLSPHTLSTKGPHSIL